MRIPKFIQAIFSKLLWAFRAFLNEAIPLASQIIMSQLKDIALNAVKEMASTDLSNEAKRNGAIQRIKDYAVSKAIPAKDSLIATLTELAYLRFKGTF